MKLGIAGVEQLMDLEAKAESMTSTRYSVQMEGHFGLYIIHILPFGLWKKLNNILPVHFTEVIDLEESMLNGKNEESIINYHIACC